MYKPFRFCQHYARFFSHLFLCSGMLVSRSKSRPNSFLIGVANVELILTLTKQFKNLFLLVSPVKKEHALLPKRWQMYTSVSIIQALELSFFYTFFLTSSYQGVDIETGSTFPRITRCAVVANMYMKGLSCSGCRGACRPGNASSSISV